MKEIIMALMIWIGANTDYNIDISNPTVYFFNTGENGKSILW